MKTTVTREIPLGKKYPQENKEKKAPSETELLVQVRKGLDARWWKIKIFKK